MKAHWMAVAAASVAIAVSAAGAQAQDPQDSRQEAGKTREAHWYNPTTWPNPFRRFKRDTKNASEELAANSDEEKKLTTQLEAEGLIPAKTDLKDTCSTFKNLTDCVASLHASHALGIAFECLKYDLTGVDLSKGKSPCAGPPGGKATSLAKAIELLKPEANAKAEAKNAMRRARSEISDAT